MDLFTYLMAKNGHNTSIHEDLFSYLLGKSQGGGGEIKTATGITINIPDAKKLVSFMMTKESTQETTTGKNLLVPFGNVTNRGVNVYSSGTSLVVNGTPTSPGNIRSNNNIFLKAGTYKIMTKYVSGSITGNCQLILQNVDTSSSIVGYIFSTSNYQQNFSQTITLTEDSEITQYIYAGGTDRTYNNFTFDIQIVSGSEVDYNFEEYTGGIPSPNPDYPQEVKTVKGYRNLLNVDENLTFTRAKSYIVNFPAGKYYITNNSATASDGSTWVTIRFITNNIAINISSNKKYIVTLSKDENNVYLYSKIDYPTSAGISATINQLMLVEGDQEKPYVPYGNNYIAVNVSDGNTTNSYPIPLNNNELVGIGDYKDELKVDKSGHVFINKKTGKVFLNGSENWFMHSYNTSRTVFTAPIDDIENYIDSNAIPNLLCSRFIPVTENATWKVGDISRTRTFNIKSIYLIFNPNITLEQFKTWLSTHNTDVYYVLATPELIDLQTTVDLKLFKGVNNVSNSEDGYMTIQYVSENKEA